MSRLGAFANVRACTRASRRISLMCLALGVALVAIAACSSRDGGTAGRDSGRAAVDSSSGDSLRVSHARSEDLTGDGRAERLTLDARGPRMDSLDVVLEIRSPADSVLYRSTWNSRYYFQYVERSSMSDADADTLIRGHLARVLTDTSFGTVGGGGFIAAGSKRAPADTSGREMMRDAIRFDIAIAEWRRANGTGSWDGLPPGAHTAVNTLAKAVPAARIESLAEELQGRRALRFFAGGEVTYAIAWSDREQRFVTIFSCC